MIATDKFKDNLGEILEFVKNSIKTTADFAKEQVPIFIEEILNFHLIYNSIWALVFLGIAGAFLYGFRKRGKENKRNRGHIMAGQNLEDEDKDALSGSMCLLFIGFAGFSCLSIYWWINIIKITVAPRLYLLEYASEIINRGGC